MYTLGSPLTLTEDSRDEMDTAGSWDESTQRERERERERESPL